MMEFVQSNPILAILAALLVFVAIVWFLVPLAIKRGVNVQGVINGTSMTLDAGDFAVDTLRTIMPENQTLITIDSIIEWAQKGVESAEQMYKASQMEEDNRKKEAKDFVLQMLEYADIEADEKISKIIDNCIEAAVFALPKTGNKEE